MSNVVWRGRIIFIALIVMFALPVIVAKTVLMNDWYQSGVTNRGVLIEPSVSYKDFGVKNPYDGEQWQLAYVMPSQCYEFCQQQLYLLSQSYVALGKYQNRVSPVLFVNDSNAEPTDIPSVFTTINVDHQFDKVISGFEYVIIDPLGQFVMRYPKANKQNELVNQSKDVLTDLRKLLKLSRVG